MNRDLKINLVLKQLMKSHGETLNSITNHTGVPKSTIADWMAGRTPNPTQAAKIATHFGVSLHFLLFDCEDPQDKLQKIVKEDVFSGQFEIHIRRIIPTDKK